MKRKFLIFATLLSATITWTAQGQDVLVGQKVTADQRISMDRIDHSSWDALLQKHVNEQGQVNYRGWHASQADSAALDAYVNHLSAASFTEAATREGQLAYWINAYNAITIKGILKEYPTSSIRNHTSKLGGYNIWKNLKLQVGDRAISLDAMEHEVLRKMSEPRIHFAIVCASHSCPRLLNRAYVGTNLEAQLTENTKAFFANSENFRYDESRRKFHMSSIIEWFAKDFGANKAAQLATIAPWLPSQAAAQAARSNSVSVSYLNYSWDLNELPAAAAQGSGARPANQGSTKRGSGRR